MGLREYVQRVRDKHFYSTEKWGEEAYYYPDGDAGQKRKVTILIDEGGLEGSNEVQGDGRRIEGREGRTLRNSLIVDVRRIDGIVASSRGDTPPGALRIFKDPAELAEFEAGDNLKGSIYRFKRPIGRDQESQTYLCVLVVRQTVRGESKRG